MLLDWREFLRSALVRSMDTPTYFSLANNVMYRFEDS